MSSKWVGYAWEQNLENHGEKLALLQLAENSDGDGQSWYSQKKMADRCNMGVRTLNRHIKSLEERGFIIVIDCPGTSAGYQMMNQEDQNDEINVQLIRENLEIKRFGRVKKQEKTPPVNGEFTPKNLGIPANESDNLDLDEVCQIGSGGENYPQGVRQIGVGGTANWRRGYANLAYDPNNDPNNDLNNNNFTDLYDFSSWISQPSDEAKKALIEYIENREMKIDERWVKNFGFQLSRLKNYGVSVDGLIAFMISRNYKTIRSEWITGEVLDLLSPRKAN